MQWLRKILGICAHKWGIYETINLVENAGGVPSKRMYVLQCEACGNINSKRVSF